MTAANLSALTFEEFREIVARELMVDKERIVPEASWIEDLQVDSIRMTEMLLRLEELGLGIPLEEAWEIQTVNDAYRRCRQHT